MGTAHRWIGTNVIFLPCLLQSETAAEHVSSPRRPPISSLCFKADFLVASSLLISPSGFHSFYFDKWACCWALKSTCCSIDYQWLQAGEGEGDVPTANLCQPPGLLSECTRGISHVDFLTAASEERLLVMHQSEWISEASLLAVSKCRWSGRYDATSIVPLGT